MRRCLALLLGVLVLAGMTVAGAGVASADPANLNPDATDYGNNFTVCAPPSPPKAGGAGSNLSLLPIDRWSAAASAPLHTRLDANAWGDLTQKVQRGAIDSMAFAAGNAMWQGASSLTGFATRFCLLDTVGQTADAGAATLGNALMSSGLVAGIVAFGLIMLLWRTARRGSPADMWKNITRTVILLGLFGIMINGAAGTTGTNPGSPDNHTVFGPGSPGWFADRVNRTVSSVASVPAKALADKSTTLVNGDNNEGGSLSCNSYLKNLHDAYTQSYGGTAATDLQATIPLTLSSMWENSGLVAWRNAQFGAENNFSIGVYCRQLENLAGARIKAGDADTPEAKANTQLALSGVVGAPGVNPDAAAWTVPDDLSADRQMVGWAACRSADKGATWTVDPQWFGIQDTAYQVKQGDCENWWRVNLLGQNSFSPSTTALNWESSESDIAQKANGQPGVQNFLLNWHGNANSAATTVALAFAASSLIMLAVFGLLALAIIIAKVAAVVMVLVALLVLLIALLSQGDSNKAVGFGKFYVGLTIFAFGIQFLFALISMVTGFLVFAGANQFGPGSILSMIWTGFAPVTACVVLHLVFTKVLKMPSPFKPSAALAYGTAVGGVAGGVGLGLGKMADRGAGRASSKSKSAAKSLGSRALSSAGIGSSTAKKRADSMAKTMPAGATPSVAGKAIDDAPAVVAAPVGRGRRSLAGAALDAKRADKSNAKALKSETKAAKKYDRYLAGGRSLQQEDAISDRGHLAWENFKDHPVRSAKTVGKTAAKVGALGALGAVGGAPLALVGGAVLASRALQRRREAPPQTRPTSRMLDNDRVLNQYWNRPNSPTAPAAQDTPAVDMRQQERMQPAVRGDTPDQGMRSGPAEPPRSWAPDPADFAAQAATLEQAPQPAPAPQGASTWDRGRVPAASVPPPDGGAPGPFVPPPGRPPGSRRPRPRTR